MKTVFMRFLFTKVTISCHNITYKRIVVDDKKGKIPENAYIKHRKIN